MGGVRSRSAAWLGLILLACGARNGVAAEPRVFEGQTRQFRVSVDGKVRGKCVMRIDQRDDGADRFRVDTQVRFNYAVYEYRYAATGAEVWKEGRLVELDNTSDYNGTRYMVKAAAEAKGLRVTVNGRLSTIDVDVWVTSYWHLPERLAAPDDIERVSADSTTGRQNTIKSRPQTVVLLDSDRGRALRCELAYVGEETIVVAGQRTKTRRYRVTGDAQADLWYDSTLRLVRQESIDQGHDTTLDLINISDNSPTPRP